MRHRQKNTGDIGERDRDRQTLGTLGREKETETDRQIDKQRNSQQSRNQQLPRRQA